MFEQLIWYLKGYVRIRITGYSPERFLNLCGRYHMIIWELQNKGTEYEMCISISSFKKLRLRMASALLREAMQHSPSILIPVIT